MKKIGGYCSLALLVLTVSFAQSQEWDCQTAACDGHMAGYNWAMSHEATSHDCDVAGQHTNSPSFAGGCKTAVQVKLFTAVRAQLMPLFQAYNLGKQLAKESRALPPDCEDVYKSLVASLGDTSLLPTPFRTGCLEVAKKQAKRIIKEDEKRTKEAAKQVMKQAQEKAKHSAQN